MDYFKLLNDLLDKYVDEYEDIKNKYMNKCLYRDLYKEVLSYMGDINAARNNTAGISIILNSLYDNEMAEKELLDIIYSDSSSRFNKLKNRLTREYKKTIEEVSELSLRMFRNIKTYDSCRRVRTGLKHKLPISKNDVFYVKRVLNYYEICGIISSKEEVLLINEIEYYDRRLLSLEEGKEEEKEYTDRLYYELPDIINSGFVYYEEIDVDKKNIEYLNNAADGIELQSSSSLEIINYLKEWREAFSEYKDFCYVVVRVINRIILEMLDIRTVLMDKEMYTKRSTRLQLINEYYVLNDIYVNVVNYYEDIINNVVDSTSVDNENDVDNVKDYVKNKLIFSRGNGLKTKFMDDLKGIDYEYYNEIKDLIDGYINGIVLPKSLSTDIKGSYFELKDDNIRVVLRRCGGDVHCILGVMIKKDNNDQKKYDLFFKRMVPEIDSDSKLKNELELSKIVFDEFNYLVSEKGRRNGRK